MTRGAFSDLAPASAVNDLLSLDPAYAAAARAPPPSSGDVLSRRDLALIFDECVCAARRRTLSERFPIVGSFRFVLREIVRARTLGEALATAINIANTLWPDVTRMRAQEIGPRVVVDVATPRPYSNDVLLHEMQGVAIYAGALDWATGGLVKDISAGFSFLPEIAPKSLEAFFPYRMTLGAAQSHFSMPKRAMPLPIIRGLDEVDGFCSDMAFIAVNGIGGGDSVSDCVSNLLRREIVFNSRQMSLDDASRILSKSYSTLRRHIQVEGTSFREIRDRVMQDLAHRWLQTDGMSVSEVSNLLGFAEPGAFHRWFKGRHHMTAGRYRTLAADSAPQDAARPETVQA